MQTLRTRWRPWLSAVALGLVLGVLLTPVGMAHLDLVADVCVQPPAPVADGTARVTPASRATLHDHCFTCHWLQSFRSTLVASGTIAIEATGVCQLPTDAFTRLLSRGQHTLPARAPPQTPAFRLA